MNDNSDINDNNTDSKTTILTAKRMMSNVKKHAMEDNCNCCLKALEIE